MYYSRRQLAMYAVNELENGRSSTDLAKRLAGSLLASGRQKETDLLLADIERELEERGLSAVVNVTSARPISASLSSQLKKLIKQKTKVKEVSLASDVDESLIGGIRIETASKSWDYTVNNRLRQIKESF